MPIIRLIRRLTSPDGRGPGNGMFALQQALQRRSPAWLKIGGAWSPGEIPWFWCWRDRLPAAACAAVGQPFVAGPNILFDHSARPCTSLGEREICQAASCRLLFTESEWYRDLIDRYRGPANRAPIVLWPYPIEPRPQGPAPARWDLLIYCKGGYRPSLLSRLMRVFPRHRLIRYGSYERRDLWQAARRCRCCAYLSDDDRGPLALAEILLCGCPAVGVATGAPFVEPGQTGYLVSALAPRLCIAAVERCLCLDRRRVAAAARQTFDTAHIVETVLQSLRPLADGSG